MQNTQYPPSSFLSGKLCALGDFFKGIGRYSLGKDYELTIALYPDSETDTPQCSHQIKGSSRHNLLKVAALAGLLMLGITAIATLMRAIACVLGKFVN
ncbi:MAG: hypothetical protein IJX94_01920 [Clostridia bacterium]|nr:hypothetical protein [Clostridia bacterium]